jgi:armadillo repeat-containing protein 8
MLSLLYHTVCLNYYTVSSHLPRYLGSEEALSTLLRANTHHAIFYAISHFTKADSPLLRAAFSRALRALATSIADIVGPSLWGLKKDNSIVRDDAQQALQYFFQVRPLDPSFIQLV